MNTPALLTDWYQLTMLQAYRDYGMDEEAVFEFFVRRLPPGRNFLLAAGLETVLDELERLAFTGEECDWLAGQGLFAPDFIAALRQLRFTGSVEAMAEGTPFFADEPVLRVSAPLAEAQLVETRLINLLQYQILVASKAVRCVLAAPGKLLVDFGLRRAHGAEAGLLAARASYLAGFGGTSNVLAGQRWGIPLFGTMAHAYIQAHDDELTAFEHFIHTYPADATLLIDTYDTEAAARTIVNLLPYWQGIGRHLGAVRIDSGDLAEHARRVRRILDAGGAPGVRIFASSNLDERALQALLAAQAPIDGFGIGTQISTAGDHPWLDCAYKLQEYAGRPRRKRSEGKATWPGRKQVWRQYDRDGVMSGDLITTVDEPASGEPLLRPVMAAGRRLRPAPTLASLRQAAASQRASLPEGLRALTAAVPFPVRISPRLRALAEQLDAAQAATAMAR